MRAFDRKLRAYTAAAGAAAGMTAAGAAQGAVVHTPGPFMVANTASFDVNFNGDGVADFSFNNQAGQKNFGRYYGNGTAGLSGVATAQFGANSTRPAALNLGDLINGSRSYAADPGGNANTLAGDGLINTGTDDENRGYFPTDGTVKYAGVQFLVGSDTFYGWVGIQLQDPANGNSTGTITDFAYENTPGQGIAAGAVPEPSGLALLALGAVGLLRRGERGVSRSGDAR
jgi:hypothetical protein